MAPTPGSEVACTEPGLERVAVPAAEGQTRAVPEQQHVLAVERRPQLLHAVDIDDRRAMDADELVRVELRLEPAHRLAREMRLRTDVQRHVVSRRLAPVDVGDAHEIHAAAGSNDITSRVRPATDTGSI